MIADMWTFVAGIAVFTAIALWWDIPEDRGPLLDSYFARQDELERRRDAARLTSREAA